MKILVTGSNGFLGRRVVERLLQSGHRDVRCFVRTGSNTAELDRVCAGYPDAKVEVFQGSLGSPAGAAAALQDVDIVYHLAAGMTGSTADLFLNSVVASKNLLEAIAQTGLVKVVLVSSFGVYGVADLPPGAMVNEDTPLESQPQIRDAYSYSKWRQETLFWDYQKRIGFPLVVVRPGVIYGPSGSPISARVGLNVFGVFLHLGGRNPLPLTYVDNCADAIVLAGDSAEAVGNAFNVHDDDLPTCSEYLKLYRRNYKKLRVVRLPYFALQWVSRVVVNYHKRSKGQLPAIFTPYRTASSWKRTRFSNAKLKALGWRPAVSIHEGLRITFDHLNAASLSPSTRA